MMPCPTVENAARASAWRRRGRAVLILAVSVLVASVATVAVARIMRPPLRLQTGDLVFQTSVSRLAAVIASTTLSPYTHVGVVVMRNGKPWVVEAAGRVRWTRFSRFRRRGVGQRVTVRRITGGLSARSKRKLATAARHYLGRRYDIKFRWGAAQIYCSELAWLAYRRGLGVSLVTPQRKRDLHTPLNPPLRTLHRSSS